MSNDEPKAVPADLRLSDGLGALDLLKRHNLLGSPLRSETLDEAGRSAADLYDRWTGKA